MKYQNGDLIGEAETLPTNGAIPITEARYQELLTAKLQGRIINVIDNQSIIYSGSAKTVYQLDGDVILEQTMPVEDETPTGWQDTKPELPPINYTTASKLKILDYFEANSLGAQFLSILQADSMRYERWSAAQVIDMNDPMVPVVQSAMGWTNEQVQDLFNQLNA